MKKSEFMHLPVTNPSSLPVAFAGSTLPEAGATARSWQPSVRSAEPAEHTPRTVLVLEDQPAVRHLSRIVLERAGFHVLEAGTVDEAVREWDTNHGVVDMLFADLVLEEGASGRDAADVLQSRNPGLKVVYTSGYLPNHDPQMRLEDGRNFLQKPYMPQQLLSLLRNCFADNLQASAA